MTKSCPDVTNRSGCRGTRGVLETLHILDMTQGLAVSQDSVAGIDGKGKHRKRLPAIVERMPTAEGKPQNLSTTHGPTDIQGTILHFTGLRACLPKAEPMNRHRKKPLNLSLSMNI